MSRIEMLTERDLKGLDCIVPSLEMVDRDLYHIVRRPDLCQRFFDVALGSTGVDLTVTNMEMPNQLPCGSKAVVDAIALEWHPQVPLIGSCSLILGCQRYIDFPFLRTPHLYRVERKPVIPSNYSFHVDVTLAAVYNKARVCSSCGAVSPKSPCEYCGTRAHATLYNGLEYLSVSLRTVYIRPRS